MEKKAKRKKRAATYAAGMDEILEKSASKEEIKKGKYTKTVQLSNDEVGS